eukprot:2054706-Rhodomonas_salina.2
MFTRYISVIFPRFTLSFHGAFTPRCPGLTRWLFGGWLCETSGGTGSRIVSKRGRSLHGVTAWLLWRSHSKLRSVTVSACARYATTDADTASGGTDFEKIKGSITDALQQLQGDVDLPKLSCTSTLRYVHPLCDILSCPYIVEQVGKVDGLFLDLHGAMGVEERGADADAEAELLETLIYHGGSQSSSGRKLHDFSLVRPAWEHLAPPFAKLGHGHSL